VVIPAFVDVRFSHMIARAQRLGPITVITISLIASVFLVSLLGAVFVLLGDTRREHGKDTTTFTPPLTTASFPLSPPEFLLRLSLFPDQQRKRQLVGVIVENQETARLYQHGLEKALFIEEFHVEGMISRFLAIFDVKDLPPMIGPIRSLRPYFVDASQPWVPVLIHAGGSPEAFERVAALSDITAINGLRYDDGERFLRSDDVPAPHNFYLPKESVSALLQENLGISGEDAAKEFSYTIWPPYITGGSQLGGSGATMLSINFFSEYHNVEYRLLPDESYLRINGGTESALQPRNVLILEMPITNIGEFGRLTIPAEGEGELLLFRSGNVFQGRWKKESVDAPWEFIGRNGEPLRFAGGATWMTQVPDLGRVEWK
jgi:hypothetical protein